MPGPSTIPVPLVAPSSLVARSDDGGIIDNGKRGRAKAARACTQMVHHVLGARKLHLGGLGPFTVNGTEVIEVTGPREPFSFDLLVTIIASTGGLNDDGTVTITTTEGSVEHEIVGTEANALASAHTYVLQVAWGQGAPGDLGDETIEIEFAMGDGEDLTVYGVTFEALGNDTIEVT
jgi:hypothetical protein